MTLEGNLLIVRSVESQYSGYIPHTRKEIKIHTHQMENVEGEESSSIKKILQTEGVTKAQLYKYN